MSGRTQDTFETVRDLEAAGIERVQAEAITQAIDRDSDRLATKEGFEQHQARMQDGFERHRAEIQDGFERHQAEIQDGFERHQAEIQDAFERHRTATKEDINLLRREMKQGFERLEALIATKADRSELYRALWIQSGAIVAILTALKYLP